jgi:zinc/manganese transport system substrate-binding protein
METKIESRSRHWARTGRRLRKVGVALTASALLLGLAAACGSSKAAQSGSSGGGTLEVVAAENFWGNIASQIGGSHVHVTSIISDPNADPHSYEPTPADGRAVASAKMVIVNGVGYDAWAPKLLAADPGKRTVLTVGQLLHLKDGDNPHRWYNPADVQTVIKAMVDDYSKLDPANASYFQDQRTQFNTTALKPYNDLIAQIKSQYSGTPVGASESIFSMQAPALGVNLITPYSFLKAITEGTDVSAADKTTVDNQIKNHQIKIYVYNSQNTTPDVQAQVAAAKAAGIPEATITETLTPATATYQDWQTSQLQGILTALNQASGK